MQAGRCHWSEWQLTASSAADNSSPAAHRLSAPSSIALGVGRCPTSATAYSTIVPPISDAQPEGEESGERGEEGEQQGGTGVEAVAVLWLRAFVRDTIQDQRQRNHPQIEASPYTV